MKRLKYKSAALVFDGAATGISGPTGVECPGGYFLNTKYLKFEVYTGRNFETLDLPDQSPDMDAVTKHIAFMGALTLSIAPCRDGCSSPALEPRGHLAGAYSLLAGRSRGAGGGAWP